MTQKEIIEKAISYDMSEIVERYASDNDLNLEVALEHEKELKRFLSLCAINPEKSYGMAGVVDELWHTFIFFTKDYFEFCNIINGNYIHHVPEKKDGEKNPQPYLDLLDDYQVIFNEEPPKHIWPDILSSNLKGAACGTSCSKCGHGCSSCGHGCTGCTRCGH
ncbi:hypothetical protein BV902_13005 [Sphingobacterium sp. B29]|uniref:glycine-rich domain-containing protein n=1 Tax=Sphingobacterium sp. B29 TaxID=1933220 RepID=UPI000958B15C|nr:hypothetical protein [Sphingobacterium sp. B29]APU97155.1 hypothetical protein BV902_13005 [Sphingobacterium sp. B29]